MVRKILVSLLLLAVVQTFSVFAFDQPKLPRVLLIGDSISMGYTEPVRKLLVGKAEVHRPNTNCGPTTRGLANIDQWLGNEKWDVIHFNWGLHDLKHIAPNGRLVLPPQGKIQVPIDQYETNLRKLVARLKKTDAKLIWCSTTPVPAGADGRIAGDAARYNEVAQKVMEDEGVAINDLFEFAKPRLREIQKPNNVHFTPRGSQALAQQASKAIEALLMTAEDAKPNVILLMCDDLGWGDVGFNGSQVCKTPNLDQMAANSLRFTRFYAAAPVCSPTRGSAITGRHPSRYGIPFANRGHMKQQEVTLAEALRNDGYATGHFGKWHLGTLTTKIKDANRGQPGKTQHFSPPWLNGFEVCFSTESKVPTWDPLVVPKKFGPGESRHYGWNPVENPARTKRDETQHDETQHDEAQHDEAQHYETQHDETQHYGTHYWSGPETSVKDNVAGDDSRIIMDRVVPFIETSAKASKPFLAVVWFHTPHLPVVAGKKYRDMYPGLSKQERLYFGCITAMDEQVGRLRKTLRALGIAGNTIVCFASDNGPENGTPGSAGHLRGRKRSLYEGGVRVPGLVEWPAKIRVARSTDMPAVTSDYFPTMLDVLGFPMKDQPRPIDGVSLLPLIEGKMTERPRPIGFQSQGMRTLSDNRYKLVLGDKRSKPELYDLIDDASEQKNIAASHADIVSRMTKTLVEWQTSCAASANGVDYRQSRPRTLGQD